MGKRIVIALGGNALGKNLPEQRIAVRSTAKAIADLIEEGHQVAIAHGNGPQVGMIDVAMTTLAQQDSRCSFIPISVCTAMSQGYIGNDLETALREELWNRGIHKPVAAILTQIEVNGDDPAFRHPSKPIGVFLSEAEARDLERQGFSVMEDAGRGWRRCVASPLPQSIVEIDTVRALLEAGQVPIACGGGGIPVCRAGGSSPDDAEAVIDKDFASELLAEELDADSLIILTAAEKVALYFGTPHQVELSHLTPDEARKYEAEGHFAPGSMLPKVQAAVKFAESKPGRTALITLLEKAKDGIGGKTGTSISQ